VDGRLSASTCIKATDWNADSRAGKIFFQPPSRIFPNLLFESLESSIEMKLSLVVMTAVNARLGRPRTHLVGQLENQVGELIIALAGHIN
jgi:hypothetical protein